MGLLQYIILITMYITSFNCRGAFPSSASISYLLDPSNRLFHSSPETNHNQALGFTNDFLCLQEHHLYPEYKTFLTTLNNQYSGEVTVCEDNNEFGPIRLRKGGLCIVWKESIHYYVSPLSLPCVTDRIIS